MPKAFDVFIYNCAGNSCPKLLYLFDTISAKHKIAYAAGPHPITSIELVQKRHDDFRQKYPNHNIVTRRLVNGEDSELNKRFEKSDAVFYIGNDFSMSTYQKRTDKILHRIYPALPDKIRISGEDAFKTKDKNSFVYIGGNGCICKGLDLSIDAFMGLNRGDTELHIFTVTGEKDLGYL